MNIKHILVPSDFYETSRMAFDHAVALARRFSARISLLHVITLFDDDPYNTETAFPPLEEYYRTLEQHAGERLEKTAAEHSEKKLDIRCIVQRGVSPYEEILRFAEEEGVDFIVMGTHGRTALSRFFLGSVAQKVIHHAACPVMVVRHGLPQHSIRCRRLVVPMDFSEQSRNAAQLAFELVEADGVVDLVHVVESMASQAYFSTEGEIVIDVSPQVRESSETLLQKEAEAAPKEKKVNTVLLEGGIARSIIDYAEKEGADLIIMGTHGEDPLSRLLIGSQTNRVIRKAPCPVITVK